MRISDWSSDVCSSELGPRSSRCIPRTPRPNQMRSPRDPNPSIPHSSRRSHRAPTTSPRYQTHHETSQYPQRRRPPRTPPTWKPTFQRSEEHTSELQSLMRISYAVFCLKKKTPTATPQNIIQPHITIQTPTMKT